MGMKWREWPASLILFKRWEIGFLRRCSVKSYGKMALAFYLGVADVFHLPTVYLILKYPLYCSPVVKATMKLRVKIRVSTNATFSMHIYFRSLYRKSLTSAMENIVRKFGLIILIKV